jgi:predicted enzyme related to lactoylglutathione lyase
MDLISTNTILYCGQWEATVRFFRDGLGLAVAFATDWFVEFCLAPDSTLSIADENRASIKSSGGSGMTISLQVEDIGAAWEHAEKMGLRPTTIKEHPWQARVFYLVDPEGHRIEMWQREPSPAAGSPLERQPTDHPPLAGHAAS